MYFSVRILFFQFSLQKLSILGKYFLMWYCHQIVILLNSPEDKINSRIYFLLIGTLVVVLAIFLQLRTKMAVLKTSQIFDSGVSSSSSISELKMVKCNKSPSYWFFSICSISPSSLCLMIDKREKYIFVAGFVFVCLILIWRSTIWAL